MKRSKLRVITYNIHKGKGHFRGPVCMQALSTELRERKPDILLCQEVFHSHLEPGKAQSEEMSRFLNCRTIYEPNAILDHGHHGNAILTGLEILRSFRRDVSTNRFERRGLLYTHLKWGLEPIHVVNVHLGLNRWQRRFQVKEISWLLKQVTEDGQPLILGGDFNDWTGRLHPLVQKLCGVQSALEAVGNGSRRSFPSTFPLFSLDRIYFRGLKLVRARVLTEKSWQKLSDHLPIEAEFESLHPRR